VLENASAKRARKGCDWIVANDVTPATGIMGGTENAVTLISDAGAESWPRLSKTEVARRLAAAHRRGAGGGGAGGPGRL
jgi:phosphopantothenoylcysteine decarboxylase/phosphopantothenate--cysteine ligase